MLIFYLKLHPLSSLQLSIELRVRTFNSDCLVFAYIHVTYLGTKSNATQLLGHAGRQNSDDLRYRKVRLVDMIKSRLSSEEFLTSSSS